MWGVACGRTQDYAASGESTWGRGRLADSVLLTTGLEAKLYVYVIAEHRNPDRACHYGVVPSRGGRGIAGAAAEQGVVREREDA